MSQQPHSAESTSPEHAAPVSPEEALAAAAVAEADALAALSNEVSELKAKNADLAEQYLRAKAEAENTRRRAEEEISKSRKFAVESFAESLLAVADSLEEAGEGCLATIEMPKVHPLIAPLVYAIPASPKMDPKYLDAFNTMMGQTPRIWIAGIVAYGTSQLLNVYLFDRLKASVGKYVGLGGRTPDLNKLGGAAWKSARRHLRLRPMTK